MWIIGLPFFIVGLGNNDVVFMILGITFGVIFYANDQQTKKKEQ